MKSSNKRYTPPQPRYKRVFKAVLRQNRGASKGRRWQRNHDAGAAGLEIGLLRDNLRGASYDGRGSHIYSHEIKYGNCLEMACLTAHLVRRSHPSTRIFIVHLDDPGDHVFTCVNAAPLGDSLRHLSNNDAIIIDPWMNVCCAADAYRFFATNKLAKWTEDGKFVRYNNQDTLPTSQAYTSALLDSRLVVQDTSGTNVLPGAEYGETFFID